MASLPALLEHLLRRAGFGASPAERENYAGLDYYQAVSRLVDFDPASADIDDKIGTPGYVGITTRGAFSPNVVINDARQRWLFRMVHAPAPLREKMALLWHNHFATGYTKVAGEIEAANAARMMDAKPSEDPAKARGQIELFRQNGLGKFRDLLVEVAKDPAMLVWLDGRTNFKAKPQENFGRELMELFTFGVANYVETDVYAAARVFTGWNLRTIDAPGTAGAYYAFNYASGQHDTGDKVFSFPIYPDGTRRIQGRSASAGLQDGLDLINALAIHPETAKRLVRKLWVWFISETVAPTDDFVDRIADIYLNSDTSIKATVRAVLVSPEFMDSSHFHTRYSWPAEYVVRMLKEVGYVGFSVSDAIVPMLNMGQALFDPRHAREDEFCVAGGQQSEIRDPRGRPASQSHAAIADQLCPRSAVDAGAAHRGLRHVVGLRARRRHLDRHGGSALEQDGRAGAFADRLGPVSVRLNR
jgi:uncharacterized protein (DUF1800 family)